MTRPLVSIVVAVSRNGVIGRGGDMPWRLSTDLKRFKAMTLGKPVIVGRKTFDSFGGRPLPGRPHVVITRSADFHHDGVDVAASLDEAVGIASARANELGVDEISVIGGGEIYRQAMAIADVLRVTHVEVDIPDGDTVFPAVDPQVFELVEETGFPAGEKDSYPTVYAVYRRRTPAN